MPSGGWDWRDTFHFTVKHMQWFYDRGCRWVKPSTDPGDVVLWDSRCVHYGESPSSDSPRLAMCGSKSWPESASGHADQVWEPDMCYKPAADIDAKHAAMRNEAMDELAMTVSSPLPEIGIRS